MNTAQDQYISIKDAAKVSNKSIQTIRRAIKSNKIGYKKQKTPQGFNYLIDRESFFNEYNISRAKTTQRITNSETTTQITELATLQMESFQTQLTEFSETMRTLVEQHAKEKENLFKLIETFQNKVISLENKLKLVEENISRSWWRFW
jgi:hypothetical protein